MDLLAEIILLIAITVTVMIGFYRLHIPASLGYLVAGLLLGPYTPGPDVHIKEFTVLAEFGVVFLLFTIGLSYSLPQLHAMRHQIIGPGTAQVAFSTLIAGAVLYFCGVDPVTAFIAGAVFAQSSSTLIGKQLAEQKEEGTLYGRLGLALSVFQDVTAVPLIVLVPVLGTAAGMQGIAGEIAMAFAKAAAAFALVFYTARWALRPFFHKVVELRSAELFTLTVLLVVLGAAWATQTFGLSLAFGAFLAGMMLGETEFRHQVESAIRPFRDVLLGMFFIGIGMLIDPMELPRIWHWALLGCLLLVASKIPVVALVVRLSGMDARTAWHTALVLAVGGEFGFALLAIALDSGAMDAESGQIILYAVLFSMIAGVLLIRYGQKIVSLIAGRKEAPAAPAPQGAPVSLTAPAVIIGGFGRMGHTIAALLRAGGVEFVAFEINHARVRQGREEGYPVMYGDIADPGLLTAIRAEKARMAILTVDNASVALRTVNAMRQHCPHVPVISRAQDPTACSLLLDAGAIHAYPEALEASLHLGETALKLLGVSNAEVDRVIRDIRDSGYHPFVVSTAETS